MLPIFLKKLQVLCARRNKTIDVIIEEIFYCYFYFSQVALAEITSILTLLLLIYLITKHISCFVMEIHTYVVLLLILVCDECFAK